MLAERDRDYSAILSERDAVHRELELLSARCEALQRAFDASRTDPAQVAQLVIDRDTYITALFHLRQQHSEALNQVCFSTHLALTCVSCCSFQSLHCHFLSLEKSKQN